MATVKIISGARNSGKTTLAAGMADEFAGQGRTVSGYLSVSEGHDKSLYFFKDLETGRMMKAVSDKAPDEARGDWKKYDFSKFHFSEDAFRFAEEIIDNILKNNGKTETDIVFIDELGPLELAGFGSFRAVRRLVEQFPGTVYLVIRENLVDSLCGALMLDMDKIEIIRTDYAQ